MNDLSSRFVAFSEQAIISVQPERPKDRVPEKSPAHLTNLIKASVSPDFQKVANGCNSDVTSVEGNEKVVPNSLSNGANQEEMKRTLRLRTTDTTSVRKMHPSSLKEIKRGDMVPNDSPRKETDLRRDPSNPHLFSWEINKLILSSSFPFRLEETHSVFNRELLSIRTPTSGITA